MLKVLVLEPIELGSVLDEEFLEVHDFSTRHGRFGGNEWVWPTKGLGDIVPPHTRAVNTSPSKCVAMCALNGCCNQFHFIPFHFILDVHD